MKRAPTIAAPAVPSSRGARERQAEHVARQVAANVHAPAPQHAATPTTTRRGPTLPVPSRPLPDALRDDMSQRFGHDFSNVRLSTGPAAERLATGFRARALTFGEHIVFGEEAYAPHTGAGRELIAHELQHVVQQRSGGPKEIAFAPSLTDQAADLQVEIGAAADAAALAAAAAKAVALAPKLTAALDAAKAATPPDDLAIDPPREGLQKLVRALGRKGAVDKAAQIADQSHDQAVKQALLFTLMPSSGTGVAGQQRFLRNVAPLGGQNVRAPNANETQRQWLSSQTDAIGKTFTGLDAKGYKGLKGRAASLELSEQLMSEYYTFDANDPKPDPLGNPAGANVQADDDKDPASRIKADCDGYATFGARLLRAQGWTTVGYLAVIPDQALEKDPHDKTKPRLGHAVALMKKPLDAKDATDPKKSGGDQYLGISNTQLVELGGAGTALADATAAQTPLTDLALTVYDPACANYDVYYMAAGAGGAYDVKLLDPVNKGLKPIKTVRAAAAAKGSAP